MKNKVLVNDFINPGSKKFWTLTFKDHDARTCNPCLIVSDWSIVREIEKRTAEMGRQGKNVFIYTSPEAVAKIEDLMSFEEERKAFEEIGFTYDPWLIW